MIDKNEFQISNNLPKTQSNKILKILLAIFFIFIVLVYFMYRNFDQRKQIKKMTESPEIYPANTQQPTALITIDQTPTITSTEKWDEWDLYKTNPDFKLSVSQGEFLTTYAHVSLDQRSAVILLTWKDGQVDLSLVSPDGTEVTPNTADSNVHHAKGSIFELYRISDPHPGLWKIKIYGADIFEEKEDIRIGVSELIKPQTNIIRSSGMSIGQGYFDSMYAHLSSDSSSASFLLTWKSGQLDLTLMAPDGTEINQNTTDPNIYHTKGSTFELYRISDPLPGKWKITAYGNEIFNDYENYRIQVSEQQR